MKNEYNIIDAKLKDLIKNYLEQGKVVLNFGEKSFEELLIVLYPYIKDFTGYEEETLCYAIQWFFEDNIKDEKTLRKNNAEDLIKFIEIFFNKNIHFHTIVYPLQKSILKREIKFDSFYFLKENEEDIMLDKIAKYSNIDKKLVNEFLEHTKNSRSKDFLKSNLLIYRVNDNTQKIHYNSRETYAIIVNILNIMYRSMVFEQHGAYSKLLLASKMWERPNRHVAILTNEWGRCGHSCLFEAPICDSDINFMTEKKSQFVFNKLLSILTSDSDDELILKFKKSYRIYMEAHKQYYENRKEEIALILYIVCLESLVAEKFNEKKLRLSVLVPALLDNITKKHELALRLKKLYEERNSFIHNSKSLFLKYEDEDMEFIDSITAKFLLLLVDVETMLLNYKESNDTKLITAWGKLLNEKYDEHLFSFN